MAIGILATVTAPGVWSSFNTFRTKSAIEAQSGRYRIVFALERMARDVSMAYLSQNEDASPERRTRFFGKRHTDIDKLLLLWPPATTKIPMSVTPRWSSCWPAIPTTAAAQPRPSRRSIAYQKPEETTGESDIVMMMRMQLDYWDARDKQWRESG